ncbi:MAG: LysM peptidoglycan-binding domain-containing protein [Bacteroidetes bacterium]|nr:MAG: LysM peptidoglycan-binding domain-containing protein [Bacteroidota bacterium]REJ99907.1 MAG: LysM peptidoglycan-binding domain-containing protein [Bacteroidota bacterium]REK35913.1 MAG: LysM peptidoglycan-binding domain-containing protein [Bacteroidota bacterium]REK50610.1 MAG: LysM peptidoglycan-binding domain-containing protein [Bacteroidota bacterium]
MKKLFLIITIAFTVFSNTEAIMPPDSIGVTTIGNEQFIRHEVEAGEGWYGIARKYGISYAELRMANKDRSDQLHVGDVLLVPGKAKLNDPRFQKNYTDETKKEIKQEVKNEISASPKATAQKKLHTVASGETLFSISRKYDVSVDQIKAWNSLSTNTISVGQSLIVAFQEGIQSLTENKKPVVEPDIKKEVISNPEQVKEKPAVEKVETAAVKTEVKEIQETDAAAAVKKSEAAKSVNAMETHPDAEVKSASENNSETVMIKTAGDENSFSPERREVKKYTFANGRKEISEKGTAARITEDDQNHNKYYALHPSAPTGTIIKMTNLLNNKTVFVKVVGKMSESDYDSGLIIKVSKETADRLGVGDHHFQAELVYGVNER